MAWPYGFPDLTKEQKHHRRQLLDWYGGFAQVSVFVPLLILQIYFLATWISRKWRERDGARPPSSPYMKELSAHGNTGTGLKALRIWWRRWMWWFGDELQVLGWRLGTKGEVLGAVVWTAWLLALCFVQTGDGKAVRWHSDTVGF
jgi:hypothetical protein